MIRSSPASLERKRVRRRIGRIKGNKPLGSKTYRAFVRQLLCCVCLRDSWVPSRRSDGYQTECAHTGDHGTGQKASDFNCIPLCHWHHAHDGHEHSYHRNARNFFAYWELDREAIIRQLNEAFAKHHPQAAKRIPRLMDRMEVTA